MSLIVRVFFMAVCVFTAYALPNLGKVSVEEENAMLKAMVVQLQNALINTQAANSSNNTQDSCYSAYSNQLVQINAQTVNQTQACYESTKRASDLWNENVNKSLSSVNAESRRLQDRLAYCSSRNTSEAVFNCNVASFDDNLGNLYNITTQSQVAAAALSGYEYELDIATQACVGKVLIGNKSNATVASNNLQICLSNAPNGGGSWNSTNPGNRTLTYLLH